MTDSFSLTITPDTVRGWVERQRALRAEIDEIEAKLRAVRVLIPDVVKMIGSAPPEGAGRGGSKAGLPLEQRAITDLVMWALEGEEGGRDVAWLRSRLNGVPAIAARIVNSPTAVSNAVGRLVERKKLRKVNRLYYLPEVLQRINEGKTEEERLENIAAPTFNSVMHKVMREYGKPFTAAEAIARAKENEYLATKLDEQPSRAYSWLSRELYKRKLQKDGELYSYSSERDGALNGDAASAPSAGEGATSPIENRDQRQGALGIG